MLLATVLGAGALIIWCVVAVSTMVFVEEWLRHGRPYVSLMITHDGEPLMTWSEYDSPSRTEHFRKLNGQSVLTPIVGAHRASLNLADKRPEVLSWSQRLNAFQAGSAERRENWYLIRDGALEGHAYLAGYDGRSKAVIGYIDLNGFRLDAPPHDSQFVVDRPVGYMNGLYASSQGSQLNSGTVEHAGSKDATDTIVYLVAKDGLHAINFDKRTVSTVALPGPALAVAALAVPIMVKSQAEEGKEERVLEINEPRVLTRLPDRIEMQDREGRTLLSTPVPAEARDRTIGYNLCDNNQVVLELSSLQLGDNTRDLYWYDAEGKQVKRERVPLPNSWNTGPVQIGWIFPWIIPTPPVLLFLMSVAPRDYQLLEMWPAFAQLLVFSLISAVVVYQHARRYSQSGAVGWALFALVFGLPAVVGYWLHRNWPHRERCANCAATVPRDRLKCSACESSFLPPAQLGIEVFA
jgi:hypothetical protein